MSILVFISSTYSSNDDSIKEQRLKTTALFCQMLSTSTGLHPFSPIVFGVGLIRFGGAPLSDDWNQWKSFCETMIDRCNFVYVLNQPGWEYSVGVQAEIAYARKVGKPAYLIDTALTETGEVRELINLSATIY